MIMEIIGFIVVVGFGLYLLVSSFGLFSCAAAGFGSGWMVLFSFILFSISLGVFYWAYLHAPFSLAMK